MDEEEVATVWTGDLCKLLMLSQRWGRINGLDHELQERLEINFCQISIERKYSFSTDWWVVKGNLGSVNISSQRSIEMLAGQEPPRQLDSAGKTEHTGHKAFQWEMSMINVSLLFNNHKLHIRLQRKISLSLGKSVSYITDL